MSISVELVGELTLKLEKPNEEYKITLPTFYTRSIVTKPWIELGGVCTISCSQTGCSASIEFILKVSFRLKYLFFFFDFIQLKK